MHYLLVRGGWRKNKKLLIEFKTINLKLSTDPCISYEMVMQSESKTPKLLLGGDNTYLEMVFWMWSHHLP